LNAANRKVAATAVGLGALSSALYALLFWHADLVVAICAKPGLLAALLPVGVAFIFSFVHGAFTGKFWDALGAKPRGGRAR
jgi:ABC-type transport system involved in multi-copper enzyme maturation permease subunit